MAKLIMWNLITLDGFFEATEPWSLGAHQRALDDAFHQFALNQLLGADMLLFGRKTYEGMAAHWRGETGAIADGMNAIPKLVASRTLHIADWNNTTLVQGDIATAVRTAKQNSARDIFVFGSADLSITLMNENLFDEYRIAVISTLIGHGRPLFSPAIKPQQLNLLDTQQLSPGCVVLRYAPR